MTQPARDGTGRPTTRARTRPGPAPHAPATRRRHPAVPFAWLALTLAAQGTVQTLAALACAGLALLHRHHAPPVLALPLLGGAGTAAALGAAAVHVLDGFRGARRWFLGAPVLFQTALAAGVGTVLATTGPRPAGAPWAVLAAAAASLLAVLVLGLTRRYGVRGRGALTVLVCLAPAYAAGALLAGAARWGG